MTDLQRQFDVNLFGAVRTTQAFLPLLRQGRQQQQLEQGVVPKVINISSIAGDVALPYWSAYCASKHALEAVSDALRVELAAQGVKVVLVKPGPVRTPTFWNKTVELADGLRGGLQGPAKELYGEQFDKYEAAYLSGLDSPFGSCSAEDVADVIVRAIESPRPKTRYAVGPTTGLLLLLDKLLPDVAFDAFVSALPASAKSNGSALLLGKSRTGGGPPLPPPQQQQQED